MRIHTYIMTVLVKDGRGSGSMAIVHRSFRKIKDPSHLAYILGNIKDDLEADDVEFFGMHLLSSRLSWAAVEYWIHIIHIGIATWLGKITRHDMSEYLRKLSERRKARVDAQFQEDDADDGAEEFFKSIVNGVKGVGGESVDDPVAKKYRRGKSK